MGWFLHNCDPKLPAMPVVRVKNKFSLKDASEYDGYRDLVSDRAFLCVFGVRGVGVVDDGEGRTVFG